MFTKYVITIANDTEQSTLLYSVKDHFTAQTWASMISKTSVDKLRKSLNPLRGVSNNWDVRVADLHALIDELNTWIPEKITGEWDSTDEYESLNRLHIHFPELEQTETDPTHQRQLSAYNDIIHELQSLFNVRKYNKEFMQLLLCADDYAIQHINIPPEDLLKFEHKFSFGDLVLQYCHVGRHPWELFIANDINCPADQILPQNRIYTYHTLRFFDIEVNKENFDKFYYSSGLQWPFALDDPRLTFGYMKMGSLISMNDGITDRDTIYAAVRNSTKIVSWSVY